MKTIEIIISPTGETRLETKGFSGSSCQAASQFLEQALGIRQSERLTPDYYIQASSNQVLREGRQP